MEEMKTEKAIMYKKKSEKKREGQVIINTQDLIVDYFKRNYVEVWCFVSTSCLESFLGF